MKTFNEFAAASNVVGTGKVSVPADVQIDKRYKKFDVAPDVFRRFETGRMKYERWGKVLDMEDPEQKAIYDYATKNRGNKVILRDSSTGAMRMIRPRSTNGL